MGSSVPSELDSHCAQEVSQHRLHVCTFPFVGSGFNLGWAFIAGSALFYFQGFFDASSLCPQTGRLRMQEQARVSSPHQQRETQAGLMQQEEPAQGPLGNLQSEGGREGG